MPKKVSRYTLGIIFIILCASLWAGSSVLIQYIYENLDGGSPFLLTYLATSLLIFHLPYYYFQKKFCSSTSSTIYSSLPTDPVFNPLELNNGSKDESFFKINDTQISHENSLVPSLVHQSNVISHSQSNNQSYTSSSSMHTSSLLSVYDLTRQNSLVNVSLSTDSDNPLVFNENDTNNYDKNAPKFSFKSLFTFEFYLYYLPKFFKYIIPFKLPDEHYRAISAALLVFPLWAGANVLYNYSLLMTSVSSSTIISNLSGSFTLFFARYFGLEYLTISKVLGVFICFAGASLVAFDDSKKTQDDDDGVSDSFSGDMIALFGALGYGLYSTVMKKMVPNDEETPIELVLGYIGLFSVICMTPIFLPLFLLGLAGMSSVTGIIFLLMICNGFGDTVLADYFWARAVLLTSPTVTTIGMSITIPMAILTDYLINDIVSTELAIIGSILVVIGFILVNLSDDDFYLFYRRYIKKDLEKSSSRNNSRNESYDYKVDLKIVKEEIY